MNFKSVPEMLEKISNYYPKRITFDDVYLFTVILADNELDSENEVFSDKALYQLANLLVGKTGYIKNKLRARIIDTEIVVSLTETNKLGTDLKYIRAWCWIDKMSDNMALIDMIENSVTNKGSISCSVRERICSYYSTNKLMKINKCKYKHRFTILNNVTDVYEWAFMPVVKGE